MNFGDISGLQELSDDLSTHARRFHSAMQTGDSVVAGLFSHGDEPELPSVRAFSGRWEEVRSLFSQLERAADHCSSIVGALAHQLSAAQSEWEPAEAHARSIGALVVTEGAHAWVTPPVDANPGNVHVYATISHQLQDALTKAHTAWSVTLTELDGVPTVHAGDFVRIATSWPPVESGSAAVDAELRRLLPEILSSGLTASAMR